MNFLTAQISACKRGALEEVRDCLDNNADPDYRDILDIVGEPIIKNYVDQSIEELGIITLKLFRFDTVTLSNPAP